MGMHSARVESVRHRSQKRHTEADKHYTIIKSPCLFSVNHITNLALENNLFFPFFIA